MSNNYYSGKDAANERNSAFYGGLGYAGIEYFTDDTADTQNEQTTVSYGAVSSELGRLASSTVETEYVNVSGGRTVQVGAGIGNERY